jgi:hypothetical protein
MGKPKGFIDQLIEPKGSRWRVKTEGFTKPLALRV